MTPKQLAKRKRDRARRDADRRKARARRDADRRKARARDVAEAAAAVLAAPSFRQRIDAMIAKWNDEFAAREAAREARRPADACKHPGTTPPFDADAARGLDERDVRRRWPRFDGPCPACGALVIGYASAEHYIAGDW